MKSLPLAAAAFALVAACAPVTDAPSDLAALRLTANVTGTAVDELVVTVSAADIPVPLVFNVSVSNGTASGTLHVPPGTARTIVVEAFDQAGDVTHDGTTTVDVARGQNPPVSILLRSRAGQVPIIITIADVTIAVAPDAATLTAGQTLQLSATILGPNNESLEGTITWATTNPAFVKVDQQGLVTAVAEGEALVVATSEGVAGVSHITVTAGGVGSVSGIVQTQNTAPLTGIEVRRFDGGNTVVAAVTDINGQYTVTDLLPALYTFFLGPLPAGCVDPGTQDVTVVAGQAASLNFAVSCITLVGSVVVTEFLANPNAVLDGSGEWLELHNPTASPVDIEGWTLSDDGTDFHRIDVGGAGLIIPPGGSIVLGNNADINSNGGVLVAYQYATFVLANSADEIVLRDALGGQIDRVAYGVLAGWPVPIGAATSLDPNLYDALLNDMPANWCAATTPFGSGDLGTPGAVNPACF